MANTQSNIQSLKKHIQASIVGQAHLVDRLLIALLADGHILVEGAPGLAKTRAIKVLSKGIDGSFQRVQFTPDLLPGDITGTEIYRPQNGTFEFQKGPLFNNVVLADEINRAPAKVQSALLEAMAERQISVGKHSYELPQLFLVMATQNPIEQEGTYPLPEAQLDRFLMHVKVGYPSAAEELEILKLARGEAVTGEHIPTHTQLNEQAILEARKDVMNIHMSESVEQYIIQLIMASRSPAHYGEDLASLIAFGASPRATIALDRCARAHAWLNGRDFVGPEDVQAIAHDVLRHRLVVTYEAEAEGKYADEVIDMLLNRVPVA